MSKKYGRYCSVYGCINNSKIKPELTYFSLPMELERRNQWLTQMGREDCMNRSSLRVLICEVHFNPLDIMITSGRKMLKKMARPSQALPASRRVECAVQAALSDEEDQLAGPALRRSSRQQLPADPAFEKKSAKEQQKEILNQRRYNFYDLCNQYLPQNLAQFVKTYNFLRFNTRDDYYYDAYRKFCWTLYFANHQIYRFFEKILGLPHIDTLKKLWTHISTQMTDDFLLVLKAKVDNMSEKEKNCSLIVSVTDVQPNLCYHTQRDVIVGLQELDGVQFPTPARTALVVMLRGLLVDWTQPVVFVFLADCTNYDNITIWIDKVILKLFESGFKIRAIVSNLSSNLTRATKKECVTVREPFFFVNEHKIYQIVDTSYLMKQVCCCFRTFDFQFADNSVAKFEHVRKFYELDKSRSIRLASDLTDDHMEPMSVDETDVRHAAQLMSTTVATGIAVFADFNVIEQYSKHTVNFLLLMNDFFHCLKNFRGDDSQLQLCDKVQNFFWTLQIVDPQNGTDVTKITEFLEGLHITIESIRLLHEDLKREGYSNVVFTKYLNQDIAESFFKKTRDKCRAQSEPTCRRLASALQRFFATSIMKPIKEPKKNVEVAKFIEQIYEISLRSGIGANRSIFFVPVQVNKFFEISRSDYNRFGLPEKNSLVYLCGCLLKKCYDRHRDCTLMKYYMEMTPASLNYTKYKEFVKKDASALPSIPPDDFVEYVAELERVFSESFGSTHLASAFGAAVYENIKQIEFSPPCPCFPTTYLQKLFVRMRIYSTIRFNNKTLRLQDNIKQEY